MLSSVTKGRGVAPAALVPRAGGSVRCAVRRGCRAGVFLLLFGAGGQALAAVLSVPATSASALVLLLVTIWAQAWPLESSAVLWGIGLCLAVAGGLTLPRRGRVARLELAGCRGILAADLCAASAVSERPGRGVPAVADAEDVLSTAKACFLRLQSAWDAGDVEALRQHTTGAMLDDLLEELPARTSPGNQTDILTLHATLLLLEEGGTAEVASVEFTGLIRESPEQPAVAFDEVWMLTRRRDVADHWRLARHQALL